MKSFPVVASVDLGSHKTTVLLCEVNPEGLEVIGFGQSESHGVRKGMVVNIDTTVHSLQEALNEACKLSHRRPTTVIVGVTGSHIQSISSRGMVPIRHSEIRQVDIEKAIEAAAALNLPLDREIVEIVTQEFIIDGQDGIQEPAGMYGKRLEVLVQVITGSITALENIRRCVSKVGLSAHQFVSAPLASARAVLTNDEKEAGVCAVDMGAASTDFAVYQYGALKAIRSLPIGGNHLTNDLAVGLKTSLSEAQTIKHRYGCPNRIDEYEEIEVTGLSGHEPRHIKRQIINTILQPRLEEILNLVRVELAKDGLDESLPSGIVFTGGVAHLQGLLDVSERVFRVPVRLGKPSGLGGLSEMVSSPTYSTLVGLMQLGFEENDELQYFSSLYDKGKIQKFQSQFSRWLKDFF